MGCGRPIVCTDLALFRELEKEHAGIVVCQPSGEDIARQIERLILDTPYRDAHLGRMHDYASRTHPRAIARQCADLYREAIEE
jgi:glycosyltransferase involved in cell wall biosynthesis